MNMTEDACAVRYDFTMRCKCFILVLVDVLVEIEAAGEVGHHQFPIRVNVPFCLPVCRVEMKAKGRHTCAHMSVSGGWVRDHVHTSLNSDRR